MQKPSLFLSTGNSVYITGNGNPLVIIGGGPGLSSRVYRKYFVPVIKDHQVICWDYAATGTSSSRESNSFQEDYEDFLALLKRLDLKSVKLLGHSYGGLLALKYASENPTAVSHLILADTASCFAPAMAEMAERKMKTLSAPEQGAFMTSFGRLVEGDVSPENFATFVSLEIKSQLYRPTKEHVQEIAQNTEFNMSVLANNPDWFLVDLTNQLEKIQAKTLIVNGKYDPSVPPEFSEPLKAISGSIVAEFQNSGHWPAVEEPAAFSGQLNSFLSR